MPRRDKLPFPRKRCYRPVHLEGENATFLAQLLPGGLLFSSGLSRCLSLQFFCLSPIVSPTHTPSCQHSPALQPTQGLCKSHIFDPADSPRPRLEDTNEGDKLGSLMSCLDFRLPSFLFPTGWVRLLARAQSYCVLSQRLPCHASWTSLTPASRWIDESRKFPLPKSTGGTHLKLKGPEGSQKPSIPQLSGEGGPACYRPPCDRSANTGWCQKGVCKANGSSFFVPANQGQI